MCQSVQHVSSAHLFIIITNSNNNNNHNNGKDQTRSHGDEERTTLVHRMPFTVVVIKHAEVMSATDLALFLTFLGSTHCDIPDLQLYALCPRALFVFSTNYGQSVALSANTLEGYRYQSSASILKRTTAAAASDTAAADLVSVFVLVLALALALFLVFTVRCWSASLQLPQCKTASAQKIL
jgi:hypothetical protein